MSKIVIKVLHLPHWRALSKELRVHRVQQALQGSPSLIGHSHWLLLSVTVAQDGLMKVLLSSAPRGKLQPCPVHHWQGQQGIESAATAKAGKPGQPASLAYV